MLQEIVKIAQEAGKEILTFYDDNIEVMTKEDDSPLTKADLVANKIIERSLKELDPDTPIISEESGVPDYEIRKKWEKFWIVDPLDGTKEFIKKNGEFTVNIALIEDGKPTMGVVDVPARKITYFASVNKGSFKQAGNEEPEQIFSEDSRKEDSLKIVHSRSHGSESLIERLKEKGISSVRETVPAGSSLKFCLVAEGQADIYPRTGPTNEWDVAAGDCVYRYSARQGEHPSPLTYNKPNLKNGSFIIGLSN